MFLKMYFYERLVWKNLNGPGLNIHSVVSYSMASNRFECCEKKSIHDTQQGNSRTFVH